MFNFQVNSIPLKDVIMSLARSFDVPYHHYCEEYYLKIPAHIGEGEIRGINFENGLGLLIYDAVFKEDIQLEFTLDEVHPLKFIYSLNGPLIHQFPNEGIQHYIEEYRCAIVASERKNGHIIKFEKEIDHKVVSVEIDRDTFSRKENCHLQSWDSKLKNVITDIEGNKQFYHIENCGIYYKDILEYTEKYKNFILVRKLNLHSITLQMFLNQLIQFDDDELNSNQRTILRITELNRVEELRSYIKENLTGDLTVKNLARQTGLNPNKLQNAFKYLFSTTINDFITSIRLEEAHFLLKNREYNVAEVVSAVGLSSTSYFSKIFKKKYGITPKKFKNSFY